MRNIRRAEMLGEFIVKTKATIRKTASVFSISKSTVHVEVSKRLKFINFQLYKQVKSVLEINFIERNKRGGNATRLKYLKLKNNQD